MPTTEQKKRFQDALHSPTTRYLAAFLTFEQWRTFFDNVTQTLKPEETMPADKYLLLKLAEEATEIAHQAIKAIEHGTTNHHPDNHLTNADQLHIEVLHLQAITDIMYAKNMMTRMQTFDAEITRERKTRIHLQIRELAQRGKQQGTR